jgi:hypothetical protein
MLRLRILPGRPFHTRAILALVLAIPLLVPVPASAADGSGASAGGASASTPQLDQKKIHEEYQNGNFDVVLSFLEEFQRAHKTYGREDSIFIAKHLAVVYTANPLTREKGKYYMNRLLDLLPSAKLVDMYVSDEIDRIFEKVREEFLSRQKNFGVDASMVRSPDKAPGNHPASADAAGPRGSGEGEGRQEKKTATSGAMTGERGGKAWYWIAAGTAIAGAVAFYLLHDSQTPDKTYVVE